MATTLSSPLSDAGGCLICQRLALAVVLVVLGNTSKEIIRCFSIHSAFRGISSFTPTLQPDTARLPVQSVPVTIRQRHAKRPNQVLVRDLSGFITYRAVIVFHEFHKKKIRQKFRGNADLKSFVKRRSPFHGAGIRTTLPVESVTSL